MIEIVEPGPLTTIQDAGRRGYADLGVPGSGAFDEAALRTANRLVGNPYDAAALEITFGGFAMHVLDAATVALAGAACRGLDPMVTTTLPAGSTIRLGRPESGVRSYLAFRGGIDVPAVLGSRSTDTLSGLGPPPVRAGDRLPIGQSDTELVGGSIASGIATPTAPLRITFGPRDDWFTEPRALLDTTWTVRTESNRIGVRLDGPPLVRTRTDELPSEPTLPGALQVPPDGRPILLGPDAPVTGGYPVIAVLKRDDLGRIAQLRPGDQLRFSARTDARRPR
ncbi:MAG: hypothetical protein QOG80_886 [Pseudonocardiales bacterium]|nr:hypothetical protein [Pseudonocardiales bacterium]